jgi:hypothetical protein
MTASKTMFSGLSVRQQTMQRRFLHSHQRFFPLSAFSTRFRLLPTFLTAFFTARIYGPRAVFFFAGAI